MKNSLILLAALATYSNAQTIVPLTSTNSDFSVAQNNGLIDGSLGNTINNTPGSLTTFTFTFANDPLNRIDSFVLYDDVGLARPNHGVEDFTLTFFDAAGATLGTENFISASLPPGLAQDGAATDYATGETFVFAASYSGVDKVEWAITSNVVPEGESDFLQLREVGFGGAVPEPSSAILLSLAGLGFITRRKRA